MYYLRLTDAEIKPYFSPYHRLSFQLWFHGNGNDRRDDSEQGQNVMSMSTEQFDRSTNTMILDSLNFHRQGKQIIEQ